MSYAPTTLLDLRSYLASAAAVPVSQFGIVGSVVTHCRGYHLGKDRIYGACACKPTGTCKPGLRAADYSVQTGRDALGLTNAAAAIDIKFNINYTLLRNLSIWLVGYCQSGVADAKDIREIIYSPDGKIVLRWDRQRGEQSDPKPGEADDTHLWHTHISYYRDSEARDKTGPYRAFFGGSVEPMVYVQPVRQRAKLAPATDVFDRPGGSKLGTITDDGWWEVFAYESGQQLWACLAGLKDDGRTRDIAGLTLAGWASSIALSSIESIPTDASDLQAEWLSWLASPHPVYP